MQDLNIEQKIYLKQLTDEADKIMIDLQKEVEKAPWAIRAILRFFLSGFKWI